MVNISKKGIDTFIVKMPFNIAFFKIGAIKSIMKDYKYENWYIGGHSLGGVVATMDAKKSDVKGLILLASYATTKVNCKVLSIYGSNDGVLNIDEYKKNKKNIINYTEMLIEGGNHANFGNYGNQKGDKESTISRQEQQDITALEIFKFVSAN